MKRVFILICFGFILPSALANSCEWEIDPYDKYDSVIFPDTHVTYWRIPLQIETGKTPHFVIEGELPKARYMGFMLYRTDTGNVVSSLSDESMKFGASSLYQVKLLPRNTRTETTNVLYPTPHLAPLSYELWYRVYLPEEGSDDQGSVTLPKVRALDENGNSIPCPQVKRTKAWSAGASSSIPDLNISENIQFQDVDGRHTSSNPDNGYSVGRLFFTKERNVAVIRFRPPKVALRGEKNDHTPSVRYWSICLSGVSGETSSCLADKAMRQDANGVVTLVVGPESLKEDAAARGFNFLPRGKLFFPILLYRTLLKNSLPELPTGRVFSKDAFLDLYPKVYTPTYSNIVYAPPLGTPPRNEKVIRLGISRELFLGTYWHGYYSQPHKYRMSKTDMPFLTFVEQWVSESLRKRIGLTVEFSVLSSDTIGAALEREALDFAVVPGYQYPWLKRFFPQVDPVLITHLEHTPLGMTRVHLVALPQTVERFGGEPGRTPLQKIRNARLGIYPAPSWALFALYRQLLQEGENPEGFFRVPLSFNKNLIEALDCLMENGVDRTSGKIAPCAEVVLIDDHSLARFSAWKPGFAKQLEVLWSSDLVPLPMILYNTRKPRRPVDGRMVDGLVRRNTSGGALPSAGSSNAGLGEGLGSAKFKLPDMSYMDKLQTFETEMQAFPEYQLPLFFFPRGSFE